MPGISTLGRAFLFVVVRRIVLIGFLGLALAGLAVALLNTRDRTGQAVVSRSERTSKPSLGSVDEIVLGGYGTQKKVELAAFKGRPLVINYWASWCLFCIEEMPDFQKVHEDVSDDVAFLGVNIQDDHEHAQQLVKITGVKYRLATDENGDVYKQLGGRSMPTTVFVDERGQIVERFSGPLTREQLRDRIRDNFDI